MYISNGGAAPPIPLFTTANPDIFLDTTEYPVFDTTGISAETTGMPFWEVTEPDLSQLLKDFSSFVNFGSVFEENRKHSAANDVWVHQESGNGQIIVPDETKVGAHIPIDIDVFLGRPAIPLKNGHRQNASSADQCQPFPFCDGDGCSGLGLSLFVAFELLLLVLIVAANVAIISVIRDLNKNNKNRQYRSNNIFKLSLAVADLCLGLSLLPAGIQQSISALIDQNFNVRFLQLDSIGSIPSIIFGSGAVIATIVGIWSILFVQIDLFMRIRWPMEQHCGRLMTTKRARIITVFIWCFSVALTVALWPMGFSFALNPSTLTYSPILLPEIDENSSSGYNIDLYKFPLYACLVWGIPFILTLPLGCYLVHAIGKACKKLRHRTQASYIKRHPEHVETRTRVRKDWEAACRTLVVEIVYVVTFLPIIVAHVVFWEHDGCDSRASVFHFAAQFILIAGSFLNLFIYHLMWKDFQSRLRSLFCGQKVAIANKGRYFSQASTSVQNSSSNSSDNPFPIRVISITTDTPVKR